MTVRELKRRLDTLPEDEEIFLLRGKDLLAPQTVEFWCEQAAKLKVHPQKILGAYSCVERMRLTENRKLPD